MEVSGGHVEAYGGVDAAGIGGGEDVDGGVVKIFGGYVYAEAVEIVNHKRMPFAEVRITDEEGQLVAVFSSSGYRKQGITIQL